MAEEKSSEAKVREAYEKHADKIWENGYRFNAVYLASKALSDWLLLTSLDLKNKKILNIGCAEPIDEIQFIEKVASWVALDINEKLIRTAEEIARRKLNPALFNKLQFVQGDATAMSFPDNTFDIVVSFSTIEHIPGADMRQKALVEIARVTDKGGHVIITVPNRYSSFYFAHRRNTRQNNTDYGYSCLYSPGELKRLLKSAGLKPIKFASEYNALITLPSTFPYLLPRFLSLFRYFGERIGYLAVKE
jgi:ubiquinone/menaquinone biosynthesis C-methylase UbiE